MTDTNINVVDLYNKSIIKIPTENLSTSGIQEARNQIENLKKPAVALFIKSTEILNFMHHKDNELYYDPIHAYSKLQAGYLGEFLGMSVYSDHYFPSEKHFITSSCVVYHDVSNENLNSEITR